jgi:uncharacterized repeat protein (TIGR01451 family)
MRIFNYWSIKLTLILFVLIPLSISAQLTSFNVTSINPSTSADMTLGWEFQANDNLIITELGFFDVDGDGILANHDVGIWTTAGTLLGFVTITPASSSEGGYFYEELGVPIVLTSGASYRIAAHVLGDGFVYGGDNIVTESNIIFGPTYRGFPGFTFPTWNDGRQYLTANFKVLDLGTPALTTFNATGTNTSTSADMTLGWEFQANSDICVTSLGFFDVGADGLLASHQVGLWTSGGTLLGSVIVTPGSALDDGFYYEVLASQIILTAGNTYRVAAHVLGDGFVYGGDNIVTESNVSFGQTYRGFPGFVFPTWNDGRQYLTANFKFIEKLSPSISTVKTDVLLVDINGNGLVEPGDQIQYSIIVENTGGSDATNVVFNDTPDGNTTLVAGSVTTTQGSVTTGNGGGDTDVAVDLGIISASGSVTITFSVEINFPPSSAFTEISNQGQVSGDNFTSVVTDDPDDATSDTDPTVTPISHPSGPFMISYEIILPDCNDPQNPLIIREGKFTEGSSCFFPPYNLPAQYSAYQLYYNALVDAEFGIPAGALCEDVKIVLNLAGICQGGLIDNPDTQEIIELFFLSIEIFGSVSGSHNPLEYYYFKNGKEAFLRIPLANINPLLAFLNFDRDLLLPFFTINGLNPDFNGIRKVIDATYYTIFAEHFSEVRLGIVQSPTEVSGELPKLPSVYRLNQNYPNPFNPTTSVSYSIPSNGYVFLGIYDVLGKEVAVLENSYKSAGHYSYSFDASDLNSGIYFYTIRANYFVETKKMLLMK